eukprot:SAG31_NODE_3318_length_4420_cov_2.018051_3_plen_38_part_00
MERFEFFEGHRRKGHGIGMEGTTTLPTAVLWRYYLNY